MLTLSIAVSPDEKCSRISGLLRYVFSNSLLVLELVRDGVVKRKSQDYTSYTTSSTGASNKDDGGGERQSLY